jgi:DNA adenine methylase
VPRYSPITWYGGKQYMVKRLLRLLPPHHAYVEVFGGGASLLFCKTPSAVEVYNDVDEGLVNFFRVLRDPEKARRLAALLYLTPFSRSEFTRYRDGWRDSDDDVERARAWFAVARQSFSGIFGRSWAVARRHDKAPRTWASAVKPLAAFCRRLRRVSVECYDFRKVLRLYDAPDTLFYLDPPYVPSTRHPGTESVYPHDMTTRDHVDLVKMLLTTEGMAVLSGYENRLYEALVRRGWRALRFDVPLKASPTARGKRRTEVVYVNEACVRGLRAARAATSEANQA